MSVEYREGDLFAQPDVKAIGHGVNVKGVMGGLAALFRRKYPNMYTQYVVWCDTGVLKPGGCMPWETDNEDGNQYILNIASQNEPGADATEAWLHSALLQAVAQTKLLGLTKLAIPRIAAGIGGLTWEQVKSVIEGVAAFNPTFTIVVVSLPGAGS